jgi:SAM-dependent methyltransferase
MILSEVIEHVGDENKQLVVDEVWRVLKEGGILIFTAPHESWFAWADHMDFKRRFPAVYRTYMRLANYTPKTPVEVGHKHLSLDEILQLFDDRF